MRWLVVLPAVFAALVATRVSEAVQPQPQLVASSYGNVVLLKRDGTAIVSVARRGETPAWSTDGRIAFVRDGDIWVVDEDGRRQTQVTRTKAIEEYPDWSPNGTIVYSAGGSLWTVRVGGKPKRLTRPAQAWQEDRAPQWSPDGRWIAFSSTRTGFFDAELFLIRPDGRGLRQLTFTHGSDSVPADDGMPAWRPDGSELVFVSNRDRNWELYSLDLTTRATTRLTETPDVDESLPRIARDGTYAFVVQLGEGRGRISVAKPDFSGRTARQAGTAVDWRP
jgi:TolB protein